MQAYDRVEETYRQVQDVYRRVVQECDAEIKQIVAKAKAEVSDATIHQYRLECLRLADGDISKAAEMFAFVTGGDK